MLLVFWEVGRLGWGKQKPSDDMKHGFSYDRYPAYAR